MTPKCSNIIIFVLPLLFNTAISRTPNATLKSPFSAMYVFGDSTVDPGNNNYLPAALFRADHLPYGENFPGQIPTGRFSDGLIAPDYIARSLGLKNIIPAYLDQTISDQDLLTGVSFGSAGSGLDDQTITITRAIGLTDQIRNFEQALRRMVRSVGQENTSWTVENAMFLISVGSNDMLFNYFDLPTRAWANSPSSYSNFLLSRLQPIIQSLYSLGARKFLVAGLPPLGCLPLQVSVGSLLPSVHWLQRVCIDQQNSVAVIYNSELQSVLNSLSSQYPNGTFLYADIYNPLADMIKRPQSYGFQTTLEGCCGSGKLETGSLCNTAVLSSCPNPSSYVFWDSIHPTQAAHHFIADTLGSNVIPKLLS